MIVKGLVPRITPPASRRIKFPVFPMKPYSDPFHANVGCSTKGEICVLVQLEAVVAGETLELGDGLGDGDGLGLLLPTPSVVAATTDCAETFPTASYAATA